MDETGLLTAEGSRQRTLEFLRQFNLRFEQFEGALLVPHGSSRVWLFFDELDDGGTIVIFQAWLVTGVEASTALYRYVATKQPELGQLSVRKTNNGELAVVLRHTAMSDYMIAAEFFFMLSWIANQADDMDDEIQGLFGGRLSIGP
jgi:hypothetical protein